MSRSKNLTFGRWAECRVFAELVKLAKRNRSGINEGTYTIDLRVETYQKYLNDNGFNLLKTYPCGV